MKSKHFFTFILILLLQKPNFSSAQDFYIEEADRSFFNSSTFFYGQQWREVTPLFKELNYDALEQTGAYEMLGTIYADSTVISSRSHFFGFGFNLNAMQCLITFGIRNSNPFSQYNIGFGLGFNQVLHFSYKTGRPLIWFEGLLNYNFLNSSIQFSSYSTDFSTPFANFDGKAFPNNQDAVMTPGKYTLHLDSKRHLLEPVAALNIGLGKSLTLRGSVAYSLFLNKDIPEFAVRFAPNSNEESELKREKLSLSTKPDRINVDGNAISGFPIDINRFNCSVALVIRLGNASNKSLPPQDPW